jgi:hypothetical protein
MRARLVQTEKNAPEGQAMDRNLFSLEFAMAGSTMLNHKRFALHARKILADEQNYFGLFALDTVIKNKKGKYRRDGITPQLNHLLLVFFTIQSAHQFDTDSEKAKKDSYLKDRPDLDKVLALLHDEGEDTPGFTKKFLKDSLNDFIDNIHAYVEEHNRRYPFSNLPPPTDDQISQMRKDVTDIVEPFDLLTKKYKGEKKRFGYFDYHARILGRNITNTIEKSWHERATRIKIVDKATNGATFVYRSQEMLYGAARKLIKAEYHQWVNRQIGKMRDHYFYQNYLGSNHVHLDKKRKLGFISAAKELYPESKKFFNLMGRILETQLRLYDHDLSNEDESTQSFQSPSLESFIPEYEKICLSPRINLISITLSRLKEVARLDHEVAEKREEFGKKIPDKEQTGMFGIPFKKKHRKGFELSPILPNAASSFGSFIAPSPRV